MVIIQLNSTVLFHRFSLLPSTNEIMDISSLTDSSVVILGVNVKSTVDWQYETALNWVLTLKDHWRRPWLLWQYFLNKPFSNFPGGAIYGMNVLHSYSHSNLWIGVDCNVQFLFVWVSSFLWIFHFILRMPLNVIQFPGLILLVYYSNSEENWLFH